LKPAKPKPRSEPDLSSDLPSLQDSAPFREREIAVQGQLLEGLSLRGLNAAVLTLENCVLDRVDLAESKIASLRLKDVRLSHCDLANLDARGATFTRTEFLHCRMTGFRSPESTWRDVLLSEGDQRYVQFTQARFLSAEFVACNFEDADFQVADLRGALFKSCNLKNCDMTGVKLEGADLRGSSTDGLKIGPKDLYGATVDPSQAMVFAGLPGIKIR
jgi:uncharacterized protein YjbI with pentapeptide repeats